MYIGDLNALKKYQFWQVKKLVIIWAPFANSNEFIILTEKFYCNLKVNLPTLIFFQVENQITYLKVENELQDL